MPPAAEDVLELLRGALDAAPVAVFVLDREGRYRALAGGGFTLTGTGPASRYLGRSMLGGEGVPAEVEALVRRALEGEAGEAVAAMHGRAWAFHVVPLPDGSGCAGLAIDATQARREADLRRESQARLAALVEALPFEVWSRDASGRPVLQSARGRGMADDPSAADFLARALQGELVRREVVRSGSDGERTFLEIAAPVVETGRVLGTVGANIDVTPLVRSRAQSEFLAEATHALNVSLEYEQTLKVVARLAVPVLADACVVDLHEEGGARRVAVALPRPEQEALAASLCGELPTSSGRFGAALRAGEPLVVPDLSLDAAEGADRRLFEALGTRSLLSVPLVARSRTLGALTFHSLGPGRYGEGDLAFARDLASRAALAVDNARLFREAREAVAAREEFLSIASHELRTPLTALTLSVQTLARHTDLPPEEAKAIQRRALGSVDRQVRRITKLVETLLDATRAHAGRLELTRDTVDLAALAGEVVLQFEDEASAADIAIQIETRGATDGAWDKNRLEQVVTNLVSNALKYGERTPVVVRVGQDGDEVVLRVEDGGPGIPAEKQAKLFQRFSRLSPDRRIGGLGLGLFIVRKIVDAHGGTIHVESSPQAGTAFVIRLPRGMPVSVAV